MDLNGKKSLKKINLSKDGDTRAMFLTVKSIFVEEGSVLEVIPINF
jgi:hypothetical protein